MTAADYLIQIACGAAVGVGIVLVPYWLRRRR